MVRLASVIDDRSFRGPPAQVAAGPSCSSPRPLRTGTCQTMEQAARRAREQAAARPPGVHGQRPLQQPVYFYESDWRSSLSWTMWRGLARSFSGGISSHCVHSVLVDPSARCSRVRRCFSPNSRVRPLPRKTRVYPGFSGLPGYSRPPARTTSPGRQLAPTRARYVSYGSLRCPTPGLPTTPPGWP